MTGNVSVDAEGWHVPSPPPWVQRFRSDSLDEVRAFVSRAHAEHSRVVHGRGPLRFELASVAGDRIRLGWGSAGLAQTIRGALPHHVIHVPAGQHNHYLLGRQQVSVGPGEALFIPAGREFTRRGSSGALFAIAIDDATLSAELSARRCDGTTDWALDTHRLWRTAAERRALRSAITGLVESLGPDGDEQRRAHCEARLVSILAGVALRECAASPATALAARRLADLEAWIDAHLAEPLTLGRLCEVSGASARSLQLAFRAHRGLSPMRFVVERRLAAAHRLLARGGPFDDVTCIAAGAGFTHLGRFSVLYRRTYGEPPSRTLARRARIASPSTRCAGSAPPTGARRARADSLSG